MKKITQILLVLALGIGIYKASFSQPYVQVASGTSVNLFSIYFVNSKVGYSTGTDNTYSHWTILKTTDDGNTWTLPPVNPNLINKTFTSIFFTKQNTGYVAGYWFMHGHFIAKTTDGGNTWNLISSDLNDKFQISSVFFPDSLVGYAVGGDIDGIGGTNRIIKTTDAGKTWIFQNPGITNTLMAVYFTDDNTGYAVGAGGAIIKTINGGTNWTSCISGITNNLKSVCFSDANIGYAVGDGGKIIKTTNGGSTWTSQTSGTTNNLRSVYCKDANIVYAVGVGGTILRTINGGINWTIDNVGITTQLNSVFFTKANYGFIVGNGGMLIEALPSPIFKFSNFKLNSKYHSGATYNINWQTQNDNQYVKVKLEYSTDGGNNWSLIVDNLTNTGTYKWTLPKIVSSNCKLRISLSGYYYTFTISDIFSIQNLIPITINYPTQNENLFTGIKAPVSWSFTDTVKSYDIQSFQIDYSTDGGSNWKNITTEAGTIRSYIWTVPNDVSNICKIRISDANQPNIIYAISDVFYIKNVAVRYNNIKYYDNVTASADNPKNLLQVGKRFRFKINATNNYIQNLLTLKGIIKCNSSNITVTDSIGTFNNILQGNSAWSLDVYEILVPNNFPTEGEAKFTFTMKDQIVNTITWTTEFMIPFIDCPMLFDDDAFYESTGNGNHIITNGETMEIVPVINNNSNYDFNTVSNVCKASDASITVNKDSTQIFSSILANSTFNIYTKDILATKSSVSSTFGLNFQLSGIYNSDIPLKYGYTYNFTNGVPPTVIDKLIPVTGTVNFTNFDFYKNVTANPANPQNLIGQGRKVRFKVEVKNNLNIKTYGLRGKISCNDKSLTITDSTAAYDEVDAGKFLWSLDEYEILIPETLPLSNDYKFTLTMEDPFFADGKWTSTFTIPMLQCSTVLVDDDVLFESNGNGNGKIEKGETIEMVPLLDNKSAWAISNITAEYTSPSDSIIISGGSQSFANIIAGSINNYYTTDVILTKNSKASSFYINLLLNGTFDTNRVIKYSYKINFLNGFAPSLNKYLIPATGNVSETHFDFYQNVTPNPANPQNLIGQGRKVRFKVEVLNNLNIRT